ncbi:hypothetical protein OTERR_12950 [Oryzomicrobium terrae]|uniref:Uncharacterized protein n=1 Tax=Oryzomicrobium terrae TaxID=1735038 RepID=A0A5C1E765_9RHOO|nr:hypothetical protein [Oryzomicrobium terrae]QEL64771.1 hypothetical protein OTERR_12950 [Oryzomicrobium terrae]
MTDIDPREACKPLGYPRTLSEEDYQRAVAALADREGLTNAQRKRAREWLDRQRNPTSG